MSCRTQVHPHPGLVLVTLTRTNAPLLVALSLKKNAKPLIVHADDMHPHEGPVVSSPTSVTHTIFLSIDFYVQLQGWSSWLEYVCIPNKDKRDFHNDIPRQR